MRSPRAVALLLASCLVACGGGGGADGGEEDAAIPDSGSPDSGSPIDGGGRDAGRDAAPADAGVDSAVDAAPPPCGGECGPDQYCAYPASSICGTDGTAGSCDFRPTRCTPTMSAACGCDGRTYWNDCEARRAGIDVARAGACESAADCRSTGCPDNSFICMFCRTAWVCIPMGSTC